MTRKAYEEFSGYFGEKYWSYTLEEFLSVFLRYVPTTARILDVGCGPGRDLAYFLARKRCGIGIDFSQGLLQVAKNKLKGVNCILMDMRHLGFKDGTFDGIWCCASLLHIPKRFAPAVLDEFARILKKRGKVYLSVKKGRGERMISSDSRKRFFAFYTMPEIVAIVRPRFRLLDKRYSRSKDTVWLNLYLERRDIPCRIQS